MALSHDIEPRVLPRQGTETDHRRNAIEAHFARSRDMHTVIAYFPLQRVRGRLSRCVTCTKRHLHLALYLHLACLAPAHITHVHASKGPREPACQPYEATARLRDTSYSHYYYLLHASSALDRQDPGTQREHLPALRAHARERLQMRLQPPWNNSSNNDAC